MSIRINIVICTIALLLVGCRGNDTPNTVGAPEGSVVIEEPDDADDADDTGDVDDVDDTDDVEIDPNLFLISEENVLKTESIERELRDGLDLDNITVFYLNDTQFILSNNTPRTIVQPVVKIEGIFYIIEKTIEAFTKATIKSPVSIQDKTIFFHEQTPFFRVQVSSFNTNTNDDSTLDATEVQIEAYLKELRGYRVVNNYFSYINDALVYLKSREQTRSALQHTHSEGYCEFDHVGSIASRYSDTSSISDKIYSVLDHKPTSSYEARYVNGYVYGMATVGNGWLSLVDKVLYKPGWIKPHNIYLHEKHHNHGFGHSGGLTYGWPERSADFIEKADYSFYDNPELRSIPVITKYDVTAQDDGTIQVNIRWFHKNKDEPQTLDKFLFIGGNKMTINEIGYVNQDGSKTSVDFDEQVDEQLITISKDKIHIQTSPFSQINNKEMPIGLYINANYPTETQRDLLVIAGTENNEKVYGNIKINLSHFGTGHPDGERVVFIEKEERKTAAGQYVLSVLTYLPEEAKLYCEAKGLQLGTLEAYKTRALLDFQHKYLPYQSMVGLSAEDGTPIAVQSSSNWQVSHSNYTDRGALIVCAIPD
ncbi:hypothetical protein [Vibrio algarum]|uniref:Uncharacterized protein n=1 Tax=Vibrio algarum TaxID=3020714 RepID=A0ABT4YPY6_9VIBR|nr:hypothetical protein [Vibrio sp. KJ40-1]MDB1123620.1 hypothetical protein [Vibrio sp. KJ40-1]